jgi:DNA-binding MarR family transcriptional regulator
MEQTMVGAADLQTTDALVYEVIRLNRLFERAAVQHHAQDPDGIERAAYLLLVQLVKEGPLRLTALAEAVHSDPSTVSRQIAQLVRAGLVARQADPVDGRASLLAATASGQEKFQRKRQKRNERFAAMLADWSADDLGRLRDLLARFNTDFERYKRLSTPTVARPGQESAS